MSTCTAPSAAAITLADPLSIAARSGGSTTSICASRSASPRPLVVVAAPVVPNHSNVPSRVVARTASIASTMSACFFVPHARWTRSSAPSTTSTAPDGIFSIRSGIPASRHRLARVRPSARARRRASRCRGRGFLDGGRRSSSLRASRRAMSYFALTIVSANDVPIYARDFTAREDDGARAEVRPEASERANE